MQQKTPFIVQIYKQDAREFAGETMKISLDAYFYKKYAPNVIFEEVSKLDFDSNGNPYPTKTISQQDLMHLKGVTVKAMQVFNQTLEDVFDHFPDNTKVIKARQRWRDVQRLKITVNKRYQFQNAYYTRRWGFPELYFFEFTGLDGKKVKTYQSLDIAAHELGHFLLDSAKPELFKSRTFFTKALHESFGDLNAIFLILELDELRDLFLHNTKGDLTKDSFLTNIAEEFGAEIQFGAASLRTALKMTTENAGKYFHTVSQVFTGAIYMTLANLFDYYRSGKGLESLEDPNRFKRATDYQDYTDPSSLLKQIARDLRKFLVFALIEAGPTSTFCDIKDILKKYVVESIVEAAFEATKITREWEEGFKEIPKKKEQKEEQKGICCAIFQRFQEGNDEQEEEEEEEIELGKPNEEQVDQEGHGVRKMGRFFKSLLYGRESSKPQVNENN